MATLHTFIEMNNTLNARLFKEQSRIKMMILLPHSNIKMGLKRKSTANQTLQTDQVAFKWMRDFSNTQKETSEYYHYYSDESMFSKSLTDVPVLIKDGRT